MPDQSYDPSQLPQNPRRGAAPEIHDQDYRLYDPRLSYSSQYDDEDGFDFWEAVRVVTKRKWLILSIFLAGIGIAALLTLQTEPLYRATATIEIQKQETQIVEGSVEPANVADAEFLATQYALLESRTLAERVVEILNLHTLERYADLEADRASRIRRATSKVLENIRVSPEGRSRVVRVQYISADPREAASVTNAIVENFIESNLERKYNTTAFARNFLTERLAVAKSTLEDAERELVDYAEEQGILDLTIANGASTSLDENAIVSLNSELAEAETERIDAEQAFLAVSRNTATSATLENEDLKRLRAARSELAAEYQELLGTFKPDYPDMIKLNSRIAALDFEISQTRGAIISAARSTFETAKTREATLRSRVAGLKRSLQQDRNNRINYTILQREVDTARSQYDALLQRLKEVSIAGGVGSSQVSIVDRAIAPNLPFEPNLRRTLLQAAVLSLALGIGLAFALNYVDDTIKTPDDVKEKLGLPAIGVIPKIKGGDDLILTELKDPKSGISEAYFSARTALEFATGEGTPQSLLVTSTQPGEGKTSTTVALATAFTKQGKKVLIVDADMRKPSFVADAEQSIGLSGLLTHDANFEENVIAAPSDGLFLLPSGVIPPNPAELLSGHRLQDLITTAEEHFDLVIVDSPPVMSFADAPILGAICKGTIVVVKSGKIRRPAAERTINRLKDSRTNVLGAVLMSFDAKKAGYDYGYYYYAYGKGSYTYGSQIGTTKAATRKIRLFVDEDNGSSESV